jgi:RNA polymerase sigma-70 factor, ECF subfamily
VRDLMEEIQNGNQLVFEEFIEIYSPIVERFAYQIGVPFHDIADVSQEVFLRVFRFSYQFDGKSVTSWLFKITMNIARDLGRKNKGWMDKITRMKATHDIQDYQLEQVETSIIQKEDDRFLHSCIIQLPDKYKIPIVLHYFHDMSYEDITNITGAKLSTIKVRIHRAKKILSEQLKGIQEGGVPYEES